MSSHDCIRAQGTVIEVLKDGACRVELANGHRCMARALREASLTIGEKVSLEFHPYDLSRARILQPGGETSQKLRVEESQPTKPFPETPDLRPAQVER